jgi:alpha-tubulin suppressor-like RCC1 family protein
MRRRTTLATLAWPLLPMSIGPVHADASHPQLASYYARHAALVDGTVVGWDAGGAPRALRSGYLQVAVSQHAWYGLTADGDLQRWGDDPAIVTTLRRGVARMAAGASGWIAIDRDGVAWQAGIDDQARRVMADVADACVGDSADYLVTRDGRVHVRGLAHRGQYGDGLLRAAADYVATATDAAAVRAHTGHGLLLRRDGTVMGTGGNRYGPLSSHGLGDKADRWGAIFDGAVAIATGSRHSLAICGDGSLWGWGEGFAIAPARLMDRVTAVAAGDTATIALDASGKLWQWDSGRGPRHVPLPLRTTPAR